jgi:hypothetical protein
MNPIQWPKNSTTRRSASLAIDQIILPELEITDSDYESAAEDLRALNGRLSHVAYLNAVAARVCRERQLREAISKQPEYRHSEDFIKSWKMPISINRFDSDSPEEA